MAAMPPGPIGIRKMSAWACCGH